MKLGYFASFGLLLAGNQGFAQTTWHVDVTAPPPGNGSSASPYSSIQYAINQPTTASGDTILVRPGTYWEWIDYRGKSLKLASSQGPTVTKLGNGPGFSKYGAVVSAKNGEAAGTSLEGFSFVQGLGSFDRALYCAGSTLDVRTCTAQDLTSGPGVFLFADGSAVSISDCTLERLDGSFGDTHARKHADSMSTH